MGGLEVTHGLFILVNIIPFHYAMSYDRSRSTAVTPYAVIGTLSAP